MSLLAPLVAPMPLDVFLAERWGRAVAVAHGPPERLPAWTLAPELASPAAWGAAYRGPGIVSRAGEARTAPVTYDGGAASPEVFHAMGLTQSFPRAENAIPGCAAWLAALADELGVPDGSLHAHVFVSPREEGLGWHFDAHDVLVVQVRGTKRWWLAPNRHLTLPVDAPHSPGMRPALAHLAAAPGGLPEGAPPEGEVTAVDLAPGSVLYVPRGTWHRTGSRDDLSVSVSVASHAPLVVDVVLAQLRAVLLHDAAFRATAWGLTQHGHFAPHAGEILGRALASLPAHARCVTASSLLAAAAPPEEVATRVDASTRFARNPDVTASLTTEGDTLHVTASRAGEFVGAFECDVAAVSLVERACAMRGVFEPGAVAAECAGFTADDAAAVLASMAETDLVRVVPFPRGPRTIS